MLFPHYKILVYSYICKTLDKELDEELEASKINLESLSEQEEIGIEKRYLSRCVMHVSELKGILIFVL